MALRSNRRRVVILALDSCDIVLTRRWAAEGHMPHFRRLFEQAAWGLIENPPGLESGSVWGTFATGVMPDVHGYFDVMNIFDTAHYRKRIMRRDERGMEPFWLTASKVGKRVAVVDFPYAYLEESLNGIQVADWLVHVRVGAKRPATLPDSLAPWLVQNYGVNSFTAPVTCPADQENLQSAGSFAAFRDTLLDHMRRKLALSLAMLEREKWDLFITGFHETHDAGHRFWHIHDPQHERHDATLAAALGNPLRDTYAALDSAVAALMATVGDATVLIYLSHGMGPERTGTGLLNEILVALDQADKAIPPTRIDRLSAVGRTILPTSIRRFLSGSALVQRAYGVHVDERRPHRRLLELMPSNVTGGIRINLKGRESNGVVDSGSFDRVCEELKQNLLEIVNEDTGEPIISAVTMTRDIYRGPLAHRFPDLLLEWNKAAPIDRVYSPRIGHLRRGEPRTRTGDHIQKRGAYLMLGPGIERGFHERLTRPVDFAPTIASLLGYSDQRYSGMPLPCAVTDEIARAAS